MGTKMYVTRTITTMLLTNYKIYDNMTNDLT